MSETPTQERKRLQAVRGCIVVTFDRSFDEKTGNEWAREFLLVFPDGSCIEIVEENGVAKVRWYKMPSDWFAAADRDRDQIAAVRTALEA